MAKKLPPLTSSELRLVERELNGLIGAALFAKKHAGRQVTLAPAELTRLKKEAVRVVRKQSADKIDHIRGKVLNENA